MPSTRYPKALWDEPSSWSGLGHLIGGLAATFWGVEQHTVEAIVGGLAVAATGVKSIIKREGLPSLEYGQGGWKK